MPSRGRARANIKRTRAIRRRKKGRWINFFRREVPALEAWMVVGNNTFPERTPKGEPEKYRYMMRGRISSSRNAHGFAKVIIIYSVWMALVVICENLAINIIEEWRFEKLKIDGNILLLFEKIITWDMQYSIFQLIVCSFIYRQIFNRISHKFSACQSSSVSYDDNFVCWWLSISQIFNNEFHKSSIFNFSNLQ